MDQNSRRAEREVAMMLTYAHLFNSDQAPIETMDLIGKKSEYGMSVFLKIKDKIDFLNTKIQPHLKNWTLDRISPLDRALLYVALQEVEASLDVPFKVAVDEALNIGKKFGDPESLGFVNAILEKCNK